MPTSFSASRSLKPGHERDQSRTDSVLVSLGKGRNAIGVTSRDHVGPFRPGSA